MHFGLRLVFDALLDYAHTLLHRRRAVEAGSKLLYFLAELCVLSFEAFKPRQYLREGRITSPRDSRADEQRSRDPAIKSH